MSSDEKEYVGPTIAMTTDQFKRFQEQMVEAGYDKPLPSWMSPPTSTQIADVKTMLEEYRRKRGI